MPPLMVYLLKANCAIIIFAIGYFTLLRALTFYKVNRLYLIAAIIISSLYPLLNLSPVVAAHQQQAQIIKYVVVDWQHLKQDVQPLKVNHVFDYWQGAEQLFWLGVSVMVIRLVIQCYSLYRINKSSIQGTVLGYHVNIIDADISPFAFWQTVYINPKKHDAHLLKEILQHEMIHVRQWHTLDILLAEIGTLFYWFNPFMWFLKKAIKENLEFITDREILDQGVDRKSYQYNLLQVTFDKTPNSIVNHFNLSTLKKRIMMMNLRKSSPLKLSRYVVTVPVIVGIILSFTLSKAEITKQTESLSNHLQQVKSAFIKRTEPVQLTLAKELPIQKNVANGSKINADTTKKVARNYSSKPDSALYIINGVENTEIAKVNPVDIAAMHIFRNENAQKLLNHPVSNKNVIVITTKNSPQGLAYLKQLYNKGVISANDTIIHKTGIASGAQNGVAVNSNQIPDKAVTINNISVKPSTFYTKSDSANKSPVLLNLKGFQGKKPLYVIDGEIIKDTDKGLKNIDLNTINAITVLKDASATALYGDAGKDGVVLITTRKPKQ
ncbi:M56 family metallopeptidase [Mucilaginibacter sp. KACC 22063]|uniref:M56 family metallopeptidase n=1 Tax=Mucilaginibacter sp. KACC 22063 TaxID=3025666 RepID=UPI00236725FB|nr:M56 family metallopeptidase [Mucilaginibacter sp. KACC 22063]WDF53386.1 M56 family metallopeptidase [Mucilaginibacter sp. KACC 22063]